MRREPHADRIDGSTRLFGIVGNPVTQVKTPQLMNALFDAGGVNAVCLPFDVPVNVFEPTVAGLQALGNLDGLVVTVPHKVRAISMVDAISDTAHRVGAINVMRQQPDGTWFGDMFDGTGLVQGLTRLGFDVHGRHVKQLGAGGAGAAVAHALATAGAASVALSDPRRESAEQLSARLNRFYPGCAAKVDVDPANVAGVDLLVNCSPVGMKPGDGMPASFGVFPAALQVVDIIMTPAETPLLAHARRCGCRATNGRPMIEGQLAAFAKFFGIDMPASFACFSGTHA
ncbi:shikimate dehydrogenase family protein [Paraburkholderia susongensis]|uniref:Shikimate dehydrogenase n=1 Tax=Paraburkholderia susongensis TaxID=1515439 RepID=A0A1X7LZR0_9BURK|nr:shikimate dehydrogenase [Paraburkholderia susongensis]SMG59014.1 shikimate dehydrogenase [Paraburkholderia susongensis]